MKAGVGALQQGGVIPGGAGDQLAHGAGVGAVLLRQQGFQAVRGEGVQHGGGDHPFPAVHPGGIGAGDRGVHGGGHLVQGAVHLRQLGLLVRDELGQLACGPGVGVGVIPLEHHGAQVQGRIVQPGQVPLGGQGAQGHNGADDLGVQPGGVGVLGPVVVGVLKLLNLRLQGADGLPGGEGGGVRVHQGHRVPGGGLGPLGQDLVHVASPAGEGDLLPHQDALGLLAHVQGIDVGVGGDHILFPALDQVDGQIDRHAQTQNGDHHFGGNGALFHN